MRLSKYDWSFNIAWFGITVAALWLVSQAESQTTITATPPAAITSVFVPPTSERTILFSDRGKTYLVGVTSGKVIVVDGSAPAPYTPPQPYTPPAPSLTGLAKQVYDSLTAAPIDAQNRINGAKALSGAIDSTISEVGGLGVVDTQAILNLLASNCEAAQVNILLKGWRLGDLLTGQNITTKEQLIKALEDLKTGLGAIK